MSMSTHVVGVREPDDKHRKMIAAWQANKAAGIPQPRALLDYFGDEMPDDMGIVVELPREAITKYESDSRAGLDIRLDRVPPGVAVLRFFNAW